MVSKEDLHTIEMIVNSEDTESRIRYAKALIEDKNEQIDSLLLQCTDYEQASQSMKKQLIDLKAQLNSQYNPVDTDTQDTKLTFNDTIDNTDKWKVERIRMFIEVLVDHMEDYPVSSTYIFNKLKEYIK